MEENKEPEMELKRCPYCGGSLISTGQPPAALTNLTDKDGNELIPIEDELNARIKELEELVDRYARGEELDAKRISELEETVDEYHRNYWAGGRLNHP
jgi:hypothetical protein